MRTPGPVLSTLIFAATLAAQDPAASDERDPLARVARAEALLKEKSVESAILELWSAQDLLTTLPKQGVYESVERSARQLLAANDPLDARRRAVFTSIAKQQVELATLYRGKKWFDTATTRLAVADRFDAESGAKERALLEAGRTKPTDDRASAPKSPAQKKLSPLLQKANTDFVFGEWREGETTLLVTTAMDGVAEWISKALHEDHEIVVEFRPVDPTQDHNIRLAVGLAMDPATRIFDGYFLNCQYHSKGRNYTLALTERRGGNTKDLAVRGTASTRSDDGFHRLAIQVRGRRLQARIDGSEPVDAEAREVVRGRPGLAQGVRGVPTCGVEVRNLRIDPLPADQPTDDELRAKAVAENQNAITRAVDEAKALVAKKQPEPAAVLLRDALVRIRSMPTGILRDNLEKNVEQLLAQTDPFVARRKKAAQGCAAELTALADEYEKAGLPRAAEIVVRHALQFDPSLTARETAARAAVQKWNAAQAAARASELAPPDDDGSAMREWFANGQKLFRNGPAVVLEGAAARAENLQDDAPAYWLAAPGSKPLIKASVSVHLPAAGTQAGLCFDVVPDQGAFCLAALSRTDNGLRLITYLQDGKDWTPLQQHDVPMDEWRLDGWHRVSVVSNAEGMVVRCNGTEIKVARNRLGKPTGRFALFASNASSQPRTIELRAFRADP